jgi:hypothetical protein
MLPIVQLDNKGLYTFNNLLSQVPPGAMTVANNIDIDRPGIAETRRGFNFYGNALSSYAIKGFIYNDTLIWYQNSGVFVHDTGLGVWAPYPGSFFPPAGNFINSTQASGNFYFTTNNGVYKLDSLSAVPRLAGVPTGLDLQGVLAGAGNVIFNNSQVGYQILFGYIDSNNNLILGAPSEFLFVSNSSGSTQNVTLTITVPNGLTTQYFVQIYRTANTNSLTVPPGNNFQLAIEHQLTAGEIAAHVVTITDVVPDTLLGAFIYTADGQPVPFPNSQPPLAIDINTFQGMTFYANFTTVQTADVTLDSVGAPNGLQIGDTFTITDQNSLVAQVYTGAAANNAAARQFKIDTSGSIAQNIDATARNLVAMINQDPANVLYYAQYITGENILPGAITLVSQNLQNGPFYINTSRPGAWTPQIPVALTTYLSSNNMTPNGLLVSKVNQPEAVPAAFLLLLQTGGTNTIIFRILALQDALYAFTSSGIYRITGNDPTTLQYLLFDSSALIKGLNTPEILNNSIYYFSTQGICSVSSGGNQIMSRNIERDLLIISELPSFTSLAFGMSYESDRAYFLFTESQANTTAVVQEYRYNWITQSYTLWTRATTAAIVNKTADLMFVADIHGNIFKERKSFTNADYADEQYAVTIVSANVPAHTITLTSATNIIIGDVIQQAAFSTQVLNIIGNVLTVVNATGFVAGAAIDFRSIATSITYAPIHGGFSEYLKKYTWWGFSFSNADFNTVAVSMSSDLSPGPEVVLLSPKATGGWGVFPWGTFPWGATLIPEQLIPTWPTRNTNYAHWVIISLNLTQAFTALALDGVSATFDIVSTRGR